MNLRAYVVAICLGMVFVVQGCAQVLGLDEEREFVVANGGAGGGSGGGGGAGGGPSCADNQKNGTETDVDCGGMVCPPCGTGKTCDLSGDCESKICKSGACEQPLCGDGVLNGDETDLDCGGSCQTKCAVGEVCLQGSDCETSSCLDGTCQAATCTDTIRNGDETDQDCGGSVCPKCDNLKKCLVPSDCLSDVCKNSVCQAPTCTDTVQNGEETDVNCGGTQCQPCAKGEQCMIDDDCETKLCVGLKCETKDLGASCMKGIECTSTFCADGLCCDSACTDACRACSVDKKGAGVDGNCGDIAGGTDPDNECADGSCNGASTCKLDVGVTCAINPDCLSLSCVDGVCCSTASCATCQTCNKTIMLAGTCQNIDFEVTDNVPANTCVSPSACDGNAGCKKNNGQTCVAGSECLNANCVDGVCCNSACTGTCQACGTAAGAMTNGVCGNIAANTVDNFPANTCVGTNRCDGAGACKKQNGQTCTMGADCLSTFCVDGVCCNTACTTTCQACSTAAGAAANGTCGNITSGTQDNVPANTCTGSNACNGMSGAGACKKNNGQTCAAGSECISTNCVDGVCCNTACTTACQACSIAAGAAADGTCGNIGPGYQDNFPSNICNGTSACSGSGTCLSNKSANGASCAMNSTCASNNCVDGVCCNSICTTACFACSTGAGAAVNGTCGVITTAGTDDNVPANACTGTNTCDGAGACKKDVGQTCMAGECGNGNCIDGYCCNTMCTATCQACNVIGSIGICTNTALGTQEVACTGINACNGAGSCKQLNGTACTMGIQCISTFCIDGVCCNSACTTTCQACSTAAGATSNGTCGNIAMGQHDNFPANACVGALFCNGAGACL